MEGQIVISNKMGKVDIKEIAKYLTVIRINVIDILKKKEEQVPYKMANFSSQEIAIQYNL